MAFFFLIYISCGKCFFLALNEKTRQVSFLKRRLVCNEIFFFFLQSVLSPDHVEFYFCEDLTIWPMLLMVKLYLSDMHSKPPKSNVCHNFHDLSDQFERSNPSSVT